VTLAERVLALDLGSTRVKLARGTRAGGLELLASAAAPPQPAAGLFCESDPLAWVELAEGALQAQAQAGVPLGIACQRSSFLLWERAGGQPVTPLYSWQDRRAARWCEAHRAREPELWEATGLPLSPHYAGPKLAVVFEAQPSLRARAERGELAFGTLDSFLVWRLTRGAVHAIDLSQAARTLLADPLRGNWRERSLELFGVSRALLPQIAPTNGRDSLLENGLILRASAADQAAAALACFGSAGDVALVNFGTGGFVLRPTGSQRAARAGFLCGPICAAAGGSGALWALEGTINGGAGTLERWLGNQAREPLVAAEQDLAPDGFALPDENGTGAPHWRPERGLAFSPAAQSLPPHERAQVFLEGLAFRAAEILGGLAGAGGLRAVYVAGGLAREQALQRTLAAAIDAPLFRMGESEVTLQGAALLAAGWRPGMSPAVDLRQAQEIPVRAQDGWRRAKFARWRAWMRHELAEASSPRT
jgi:glycerol kinase